EAPHRRRAARRAGRGPRRRAPRRAAGSRPGPGPGRAAVAACARDRRDVHQPAAQAARALRGADHPGRARHGRAHRGRNPDGMNTPYSTDGHYIHPSILNADFMSIGTELDRIATADSVHVDVMDNHFVPNLTFGASMVEQIVERSAIPVDAHLMIEDADDEAPAYAEAGAASGTFYLEAARAAVELARDMRRQNTQAGVYLRTATAVEPLQDINSEFDMLLLMTVEPGFGGQSFLDTMLPKIRRARAAISEANLEVSIQVDGGVSRETIERCAEAGANIFVAGSAIYRAQDAAEAISDMRELAQRHTAL